MGTTSKKKLKKKLAKIDKFIFKCLCPLSHKEAAIEGGLVKSHVFEDRL